MYEHSNCHNAPVRTEPQDELDDPEGKTFFYVCTTCQKPCDVTITKTKYVYKVKCKDCDNLVWKYSKTGLCINCANKMPSRRKAIAKSKLNANNPMWVGSKVGYAALHNWVRRRLIQPKQCDSCHHKSSKLDLANVSQQYKRNITDWEWLCRRCHMNKDGRINNLIQYSLCGNTCDIH